MFWTQQPGSLVPLAMFFLTVAENWCKGQQPLKKWVARWSLVAFAAFRKRVCEVTAGGRFLDNCFRTLPLRHCFCHLRKIFLISAKCRHFGRGISCNDTTSLLQNHPIKRSLGDAVPAHKFSIFLAIPEENSQPRHKKV